MSEHGRPMLYSADMCRMWSAAASAIFAARSASAR
jgi:hypothetical protein